MLDLFRKLAWAEGWSTLALFLLAMPLKYIFDWPALIRPVGWIHGLLFIAYMVAMVPGLWGRRAGVLGWLRTFLAAFFPFGTFLNAGFLRRLGDQSSGSANT